MNAYGWPTTIAEIEAFLAQTKDPEIREGLQCQLSELKAQLRKTTRRAERPRSKALAEDRVPRELPQRLNQLAFDEVPPIGFVARSRSQPFRLMKATPYRKNRRNTHLLTWACWCANCRSPYEITLPLSGAPYPNRRCEGCRQPGIKAVWRA